MVGRIVNGVARRTRWIRFEIMAWYRAFLGAIPGDIGCLVRGKLYGFACGRRARLWDNVIVYHPHRLRLGANVQIVPGCQINAGGGVEIGDNTLVGPGVFIWSQNHAYARADTPIHEQGYEYLPVKIEEDVWIGAGAIILPGVCLRRGSVIAAGSVVTNSTDPNTLYAGVPARPVKTRSGVVGSHATDDLSTNGVHATTGGSA